MSAEMMAATEIRWTFESPEIEALSKGELAALEPAFLLEYAFDLQTELASVRVLLHESLGALTRAHAQHGRFEARIRNLLQELTVSREAVSILSAQLRAMQEAN